MRDRPPRQLLPPTPPAPAAAAAAATSATTTTIIINDKNNINTIIMFTMTGIMTGMMHSAFRARDRHPHGPRLPYGRLGER